MAAPSIAIWIASHAFYFLAAVEPLYKAPRPILSYWCRLLVLALLYFLLNSLLIAWAVAFEKQFLPLGFGDRISCGFHLIISVEHLSRLFYFHIFSRTT